MASKTFRLTLVRHGQTTYNKLKIIQGQMDTQLTDLGRDQAKLLNDYLSGHKIHFDKVYSSDLIRAFETCQIVCTGTNYELNKNELLRERSFGVLQDKPLSILRSEAYKAGYDESNFTKFRPEGGETMEEVLDRIERFCTTVMFPEAAKSNKILIVTHGGVIREFMKLFIKYGCPLENKELIVTPNTAMNVFDIELTNEHKVRKIVPISLHNIPHLTSKAKSEALSEEQLNTTSTKDTEYAI